MKTRIDKLFSFIREMLSEDGRASSKRVIMFATWALFAFEQIYNLLTGKAPSEGLQKELFEVLLVTIGTVFGSPWMRSIGNKKTVEITKEENKQEIKVETK